MYRKKTRIFVVCPFCGWQDTLKFWSAVGYRSRFLAHWVKEHCKHDKH